MQLLAVKRTEARLIGDFAEFSNVVQPNSGKTEMDDEPWRSIICLFWTKKNNNNFYKGEKDLKKIFRETSEPKSRDLVFFFTNIYGFQQKN